MKKLYRSRTNRMIFGVCGGLGKCFKLDPVFIRVLFMLLAIPTIGGAAILYLILAILIPLDPKRPNRPDFMNHRTYTKGTRTRHIKEAEKVDD